MPAKLEHSQHATAAGDILQSHKLGERSVRVENVAWLDATADWVVGLSYSDNVVCVRTSDLRDLAAANKSVDARNVLRVAATADTIDRNTRLCIVGDLVVYAMRDPDEPADAGASRTRGSDRIGVLHMPHVPVAAAAADDACEFGATRYRVPDGSGTASTTVVACPEHLRAQWRKKAQTLADLCTSYFVDRYPELVFRAAQLNRALDSLDANTELTDEQREAEQERLAADQYTDRVDCAKLLKHTNRLSEAANNLRMEVYPTFLATQLDRVALAAVPRADGGAVVTRCTPTGTRVWYVPPVDARTELGADGAVPGVTPGATIGAAVTDAVRVDGTQPGASRVVVLATPLCQEDVQATETWLAGTRSGTMEAARPRPPLTFNGVIVMNLALDDYPAAVRVTAHAAREHITDAMMAARVNGDYQAVPDMPHCMLAPFAGGPNSVRAMGPTPDADGVCVTVVTRRATAFLGASTTAGKLQQDGVWDAGADGWPRALECIVLPDDETTATVFYDGTLRLMRARGHLVETACILASLYVDSLQHAALGRALALHGVDQCIVQLLPHGRVRFLSKGHSALLRERRMPTDPIMLDAARSVTLAQFIDDTATRYGENRDAVRTYVEGWRTRAETRRLPVPDDLDALVETILRRAHQFALVQQHTAKQAGAAPAHAVPAPAPVPADAPGTLDA